jgi:hypothetical protein
MISITDFTLFLHTGLDPARPLIDEYGDPSFKLSKDDASHVQVIHTNAGFLGAEAPMGHVDFCVNGGRIQPSCTKKFNPLRPIRKYSIRKCFILCKKKKKNPRHIVVVATKITPFDDYKLINSVK